MVSCNVPKEKKSYSRNENLRYYEVHEQFKFYHMPICEFPDIEAAEKTLKALHREETVANSSKIVATNVIEVQFCVKLGFAILGDF